MRTVIVLNDEYGPKPVDIREDEHLQFDGCWVHVIGSKQTDDTGLLTFVRRRTYSAHAIRAINYNVEASGW